MRRYPHRRRGFTLLELMVALVILGIAMVGTVGFMRWVLRSTDLSGRLSVANTMTQAKLEQLIAANATGSGTDSASGYNRSWTITATGTVRYLSVTTTYTGIEQALHSVTLRQAYTP